MKDRIIGYDLARALALFGMIVVNYKIVMGAVGDGPSWLVGLVGLLDGRAAAIFVVLAGIGISLMSRDARATNDLNAFARIRKVLLRRALFLFVIGLLFAPIWPADILHFYGVYLAVAAFLLRSSMRTLSILSGVLVVGFAMLLFVFNYEQGWNWETLDYAGFWTPQGMVRHLFYNGFHPVIPWFAFLTFGMILGRFEMKDEVIRRRVFWSGLGVALVAEGLSWLLVRIFSEEREVMIAVFGTAPMPPMPLYMLAGAGAASAVIAAAVGVGIRCGSQRWISPLAATGQFALTLYVAHVVIGMGLLEVMGRLENQTLLFSLLASVVFSIASVVFASLWSRRFKRGPIEGLMRFLTEVREAKGGPVHHG